MFAARGGFLAQPVAAAGGFGNSAYWSGSSTSAYWMGTTNAATLINWKATTGYTIEYWFYAAGSLPASINPGPGLQDTTGTNYWTFGPISTGAVEMYFWTPGQSTIRTAAGAVLTNAWNNICMVCTSTTESNTIVQIYVNGIRQNIQLNGGAFNGQQTATNPLQSDGATPFRWGVYGGSIFTNFYMNNLRVSNTNRYSGASYSLATQPFVSDASTQLLVTCDGPNGSTVYTDGSSFNRTITNNAGSIVISNTHANHT